MKRRYLDEAYPIGSIIMSMDGKNPSEYIGGTWESYAKGKMIIGADGNKYLVGNTGGQNTITLKKENIANHQHYVVTAFNGSHKHNVKSTQLAGNIKGAITENSSPKASGICSRSDGWNSGDKMGFGEGWQPSGVRIDLTHNHLTNYVGPHTHTVHLDQAGEDNPKVVSVENTNVSAYIFRRVE